MFAQPVGHARAEPFDDMLGESEASPREPYLRLKVRAAIEFEPV